MSESRNIKTISPKDQNSALTKFQGLRPHGSKSFGGVSDWKNARWSWKDAVCRAADLTDGAKLLAVRIVDSFAHHETAFCNPSIETMAEALGKSGRSVQRALVELQAAGWIRVEYAKGRGRTSKIAFLTGPCAAAFDAPEKVTRLAARHADQPETYAESQPERVTADAEIGQEKVTAASPFPKEKVTNLARKGDSRVTPILKPKNNQNSREADPAECPVALRAVIKADDQEGRIEDWDAWLSKRGLRTLRELRCFSSNGASAGFGVPFPRPPSAEDALETRIAMKWADWATERMEARHDH